MNEKLLFLEEKFKYTISYAYTVSTLVKIPTLVSTLVKIDGSL